MVASVLLTSIESIREDKETEWRSLGSERCVDSIKVYGSSDRSTGGIKVFGRN